MNHLDPVANFGTVVVDGTYDASATSISLQSSEGAKLPATSEGSYNLVWWNATDYDDPESDPNVEIVRCTNRSTDTLTVTRAQEGIGASTKSTSGKTYKMRQAFTEKAYNDIDTVLARALGLTGAPSTLQISGGAITVTGNYHTVQAETGNDDTLTAINKSSPLDGDLLLLEPLTSQSIEISDSGTISVGDSDIYIGGDSGDKALFIYRSSQWCLVSHWSAKSGWTREDGTGIASELSPAYAIRRGVCIYENGETIDNYGSGMASIIASQRHLLTLDRRDDDGTILSFRQDGTLEGYVGVTGSTVSYNTFLGAHPVQTEVPQLKQGQILITTGEAADLETQHWVVRRERHGRRKEARYYREEDVPEGDSIEHVVNRRPTDVGRQLSKHRKCSLSNRQGDSRVFGVVLDADGHVADDAPIGRLGERIYSAAAIGLFRVRVTDTAGDIHVGDYIQSSAREGEGEKQADDILHSYTVAKALADVDWSRVDVDPELGYKWMSIPATLHCG